MKRKFAFTVALWWIILCAIAGFFLIVATNKHSRLSETENRMLAAFPEANAQTLASGEFMTGFEDFLSDAFFGRDEVVKLTNGLLDRFSTLSEDEKLVVQARDMERRMATEGINPAADPQADAQEESEIAAEDAPATAEFPAENGSALDALEALEALDVPDSADAPDALDAPAAEAPAPADDGPLVLDFTAGGKVDIGGNDNGDSGDDSDDGGSDAAAESDDDAEGGELKVEKGKVPVTKTNCFMWLKKKNGGLEKIYTFSNNDVKTFAKTLRMYLKYLPSDGHVLFTQVPLASISHRWTYSRSSIVGWGSSVEMVLEKFLEGEDRIMVFNTMEILEPYIADGKKMFYDTDHHWSAEGAYAVCAEMMRRQGMPVIPYSEYSFKSNVGREWKGHRDTFNILYPLLPGHSYVITKVKNSKEVPLMNYRSHGYLSFMNNTRFPWRRVVTGANTGRRALVICDSFGNAFAPWLLPYYDEVHMVDPRSEYHSRGDAGASIGKLIQYHKIDDVYIVLSTANGLRKKNALVYLRKYLEHW